MTEHRPNHPIICGLKDLLTTELLLDKAKAELKEAEEKVAKMAKEVDDWRESLAERMGDKEEIRVELTNGIYTIKNKNGWAYAEQEAVDISEIIT